MPNKFFAPVRPAAKRTKAARTSSHRKTGKRAKHVRRPSRPSGGDVTDVPFFFPGREDFAFIAEHLQVIDRAIRAVGPKLHHLLRVWQTADPTTAVEDALEAFDKLPVDRGAKPRKPA